jgi:hypothetical protein
LVARGGPRQQRDAHEPEPLAQRHWRSRHAVVRGEGTRSFAAALDDNATLTSLNLDNNDIGAQGARALAAALGNNATLTRLDLGMNGSVLKARSLAGPWT